MKWIYAKLCKLERVICTICLCGCVVSLFSGAVMRIIGFPLLYSTDIALFLFAWCIFLGVGAAYRDDRLVYVNVFIDKVPPHMRRRISALSYLLIGLFLGVMLLFGIQLCINSRARSWPSIPWLSYSWVTMSVPVGCLSLLVSTAIKFYKRVIRGEEEVKSDYTSEL